MMSDYIQIEMCIQSSSYLRPTLTEDLTHRSSDALFLFNDNIEIDTRWMQMAKNVRVFIFVLFALNDEYAAL